MSSNCRSRHAPLRILIAGGSGYLGRALLPQLLRKFPQATIVALSRDKKASTEERIEWRQCDLFSLRSLREAAPETFHLAIYLVHSMGPTAKLDQGSFADYDLLLADNFSRLLAAQRPEQLIYVGGLIPEGVKLSLHLQSRWEVEQVLAASQVPLTIFRAGLILGREGSSAQILLKLVKRLPLMVCPSWTQTLTTPVALSSVVDSLVASALNKESFGKRYDLTSTLPLTYLQMMRETARLLNKRRLFFTVPLFTPTLSRLWVSVITNTPRDLVYPLISSLQHPMVADPDHHFPGLPVTQEFAQIWEGNSSGAIPRRLLFRRRQSLGYVRSVQRVKTRGSAQTLRKEYFNWLGKLARPVLSVEHSADSIYLRLRGTKLSLLTFSLAQDRSGTERQVLYLTGGLLNKQGTKGRLEFRQIQGTAYSLIAIHDFQPALPWFIYKYSQAIAHLLCMRAFCRYIERTKL